MTVDITQLEVRNNPAENRFELQVGEYLAQAVYLLEGSTITFIHTEVPPELEGQGVGSKLAKGALDYSVEHGYKIVALCPFIAAYIRRHPEYKTHK